MTRVLVVDAPRIAGDLRRHRVADVDECVSGEIDVVLSAGARGENAALCDVLVIAAVNPALDARLLRRCDLVGVRVVAAAASPADRAHAVTLGIAFGDASDVWSIIDAFSGPIAVEERGTAPERRGRVIVVWGPHGAPGRSSVAALLSAELARGGRRLALVDADSHAPSIALMLGLSDEAPGFAAACRAASRGGFDDDEFLRIAQSVRAGDTRIDVLSGINRPGRWPELAADRVTGVLDALRDRVDFVIVDVAASLETDEELMSDLEGPRRNAATLAALACADVIVAVGTADPRGAARLLRGLSELRAHSGTTPVRVLINGMRAGMLGMDPRGQIRRAFDRFGGIDDLWFLPWDQRTADAALRDGRMMSDVAPRSALVNAMRRFVGEGLVPSLGIARADRDQQESARMRSRARRRRERRHPGERLSSRRSLTRLRGWLSRTAKPEDDVVRHRRSHLLPHSEADDSTQTEAHTVLPSVVRPQPAVRASAVRRSRNSA